VGNKERFGNHVAGDEVFAAGSSSSRSTGASQNHRDNYRSDISLNVHGTLPSPLPLIG
jgi:hypothetical protein